MTLLYKIKSVLLRIFIDMKSQLKVSSEGSQSSHTYYILHISQMSVTNNHLIIIFALIIIPFLLMQKKKNEKHRKEMHISLTFCIFFLLLQCFNEHKCVWSWCEPYMIFVTKNFQIRLLANLVEFLLQVFQKFSDKPPNNIFHHFFYFLLQK